MSKLQILVLVVAVGLVFGFLVPITQANSFQHIAEQLLLASIPATAGIVLIAVLRKTGH